MSCTDIAFTNMFDQVLLTATMIESSTIYTMAQLQLPLLMNVSRVCHHLTLHVTVNLSNVHVKSMAAENGREA